MVRNGGTATLTIDPNGAETINGSTTLVLQAGQAAFIFDGGAGWEAIIAGDTPWTLCEPPRTVAAVAQADFLLPARFRRFRLTAQNIRPDTTGRALGLRFSTDNGSSFIAGTNYVISGLTVANGVTAALNNGAAGTGYVLLASAASGGAHSDSTAEIFTGSGSAAATFKALAHGNNGTHYYIGNLGGACSVTGTANAIRLLTTTGDAAGTAAGTFSGVLILEGMA